jgi:hypothetical protein
MALCQAFAGGFMTVVPGGKDAAVPPGEVRRLYF